MDAIEDTRQWLERAVIGLNLCPFAKAVHMREQIRWVESTAADPGQLREDLVRELEFLAASDPGRIETTLLIHPRVLSDFLDYNDFLDVADAAVAALGLDGVIQVASFHPDYQFAGTAPDAVENLSNRSPHPMLHLLREDSIARAVAAFPDAAAIYDRNIEALRRLGFEGWRRLMSGPGGNVGTARGGAHRVCPQPATMSSIPPDDGWKAGDLYEPYVGRWSRRVADAFLAWLPVPGDADWADVGCGTGALSEAIFRSARPRSVKGFDPSAGFLQFARRRLDHPSVTFTIADARSLPLASNSVDAAVAGLVINFVPEPAVGLQEMARVTRAGGTVAAYVWDYAGRMELMRHFWDAAAALDPAAESLDEGRRFPLCRPEPLEKLFTAAGLREVATQPIDIATDFASFEDFWSPFMGGQGPAPAYAMALSEDRREALRERVRAALPVRDDGSIHLTARAWAVRGRKLSLTASTPGGASTRVTQEG